jgi:RNA polymerase sigma factor (sigma-70 family)
MSKNPSKSDEGICISWESFCENPREQKRGLDLANRIVKNRSLAEDILHDINVRMLKRKNADEKEIKPKYFLKAMKNGSLTELGKRSRLMLTNAVQIDRPLTGESEDGSGQIPDTGFNPEMEAERCETNNRFLRIVRSCSQNLTDREKALFLSHLRGYTNEEIAEAWGEDIKLIQEEMNAVIAKMRYRCRRENKKQGGQ